MKLDNALEVFTEMTEKACQALVDTRDDLRVFLLEIDNAPVGSPKLKPVHRAMIQANIDRVGGIEKYILDKSKKIVAELDEG